MSFRKTKNNVEYERWVERFMVKSSNKHIIRPMFRNALLSRNMYNVTVYYLQKLENIKLDRTSIFEFLRALVALEDPDYYALSTNVAQVTIQNAYDAFKGYDALKELHKNDPKNNQKPNIPKCKKEEGEYHTLTFTQNTFRIQGDYLLFPDKMGIPKVYIPKCYSRSKDIITQVRLIALKDTFMVEFVCKRVKQNVPLIGGNLVMGIDPGMINFATTFILDLDNNKTFQPKIISGKHIVSKVKFNSKKISKKTKKLQKFTKTYTDKKTNETKSVVYTKGCKANTKQYEKQTRQTTNFCHKASRSIINDCITNQVGCIILGYNKGWKSKNKRKQSFSTLPHYKFKQQLKYKAERAGIIVIETNEAYTSKTDSLSLEGVHYHNKYKGKRLKRGLFKSNTGKLINADVNGALNIIRNGSDQIEHIPNFKCNCEDSIEYVAGIGRFALPIIQKVY